MTEKFEAPPTDKLYPLDISPLIETLEELGMAEKEVKAWFRENYNDYIIHCEKYYTARNAGDPNPLQQPIEPG